MAERAALEQVRMGAFGFTTNARDLGLTPRTSSEIQYLDGRIDAIPLAWGTIGLYGETREGFVHMQRGSDEAIVGVDSKGIPTVLGHVPTRKGAHCVAADDRDQAWVCDPSSGRLVVVKDTFPASASN